MAVADDATRQRQADSPPFLLGRESGLEDSAPELSRDSRTVVGDANAHLPFGKRGRGELDAPPPTGKRVDRILRQRLDGPLKKDWISADEHRLLRQDHGDGHSLC